MARSGARPYPGEEGAFERIAGVKERGGEASDRRGRSEKADESCEARGKQDTVQGGNLIMRSCNGVDR